MDTLSGVRDHLKAEVAEMETDIAALTARKAAALNLLGEVETAMDKAARPTIEDVKELLNRVVTA